MEDVFDINGTQSASTSEGSYWNFTNNTKSNYRQALTGDLVKIDCPQAHPYNDELRYNCYLPSAEAKKRFPTYKRGTIGESDWVRLPPAEQAKFPPKKDVRLWIDTDDIGVVFVVCEDWQWGEWENKNHPEKGAMHFAKQRQKALRKAVVEASLGSYKDLLGRNITIFTTDDRSKWVSTGGPAPARPFVVRINGMGNKQVLGVDTNVVQIEQEYEPPAPVPPMGTQFSPKDIVFEEVPGVQPSFMDEDIPF